jgi:hypothetical protein
MLAAKYCTSSGVRGGSCATYYGACGTFYGAYGAGLGGGLLKIGAGFLLISFLENGKVVLTLEKSYSNLESVCMATG